MADRGLDFLEQRQDARECIKDVKAWTCALSGGPFGVIMAQHYFPEWASQSELFSPGALLIVSAVMLACGLIRIEIIKSDWRRINIAMHEVERREGRGYSVVDDDPRWNREL